MAFGGGEGLDSGHTRSWHIHKKKGGFFISEDIFAMLKKYWHVPVSSLCLYNQTKIQTDPVPAYTFIFHIGYLFLLLAVALAVLSMLSRHVCVLIDLRQKQPHLHLPLCSCLHLFLPSVFRLSISFWSTLHLSFFVSTHRFLPDETR